jgi:hypothetical protein
MGIPDTVQADLTGIAGDHRADIPASPYFFLIHRPMERGSWDLVTEGVDGPTWVPAFSPFQLQAGAAGVRTLEKGEPADRAWSAAIQRLRDQGQFVLPMDTAVPAELCPEGVAPGSLVRSTEVKGGGKRWHTAFEKVERGLGGKVSMVTDRAAWNRFRAWLVADGKVPAPMGAVLRDYKEQLGERLVATQRDENLSDSAKASREQRYSTRGEQAAKAVIPTKSEAAPKRKAAS